MSVIDKIKGVFTGGEEEKDAKKDTNPNTPEQQKFYDVVMADYNVFREKRQEIEATWQQEDRFYEGGKKHWEGLRSEDSMKSRPNSVDNVAWSQIESIVAGLTGWSPVGEFKGQEPNDDQKAQELTAYFPYELEQMQFYEKYMKAVRRFVTHGLWVTKTVHDPTITGGYGDKRFIGRNDFIPLDYGSFFPDPRIGDFLYLQQSKALVVHTVKDLEYFAERFGEQGKKVQEDNMSADVEIFDTNKSDSTPYKARRSGLIEYWYKGKPKLLTDKDKKLFKELAAEKLAEGKDPSMYEARAAGTVEGVHCVYVSTSGVYLEHIPYIYDHGQYPIQVKSLFPVEGSLWPKGYMRDLISPQIMLNKFSELAVEQMAKMGNGAIVYEEGSIPEAKVPLWKRMRSAVGAMLPVTSINGFKELQGTPPPPLILSLIEHYLNMLQKIPRRFDSVNGAANPQVTSGRQAEALQSASQGHLSVPALMIQAALQEVFAQMIELMAQFYKQERVGRITGKVVGISSDKIKGLAPAEYETTGIDPLTGEEQPQIMQLQEEYVPSFDIRVKIGVEKPSDREYYVQMAMNLFQTIDPQTGMPMIDAKALQYAVENGRMEPFELINERMQKDAMMQQQMQQMQMQLEQMGQENQMLQQALGQAEQNNMASQTEAMNLQQQQEDKAHQRWMDQQKLGLEASKVAAMNQRQPAGMR